MNLNRTEEKRKEWFCYDTIALTGEIFLEEENSLPDSARTIAPATVVAVEAVVAVLPVAVVVLHCNWRG